MKESEQKYNLSNESIEKICAELENFFNAKKAEPKEAMRIRLLAEETLLSYRDRFGEAVNVEVHTSVKFTKLNIQLRLFCDNYNPFEVSGEAGVMSSIVSSLEKAAPYWQYVKSEFDWVFDTNARNEIKFSVPRVPKTTAPTRILIALIIGIALGFGFKYGLSAESSSFIASSVLLPLADAYTGMLSTFAILLIFFSIPLCIVSYGNASEFENATRRVIKTFAGISVIIAIVTCALCLKSFGFDTVGQDATGVIPLLINVFTGFFPTNFLAPFLNFNCLQVMIIGTAFGFSFLLMGNANKTIVDVFDKANLAAVFTNAFLTRFISIYVGVMICYMVLTSSFGLFKDFARIFIYTIGFSVALFVIFTGIVCWRFKISPVKFVKKLMPSFIVGLSSANLGASFMVFFCELTDNCGVDVGYTGAAVNIGVNIFKPLYVVYLSASAMMVAHMTGCLSPSLALLILIYSFVLPMTIPNIPGGAASVIILMLNQLGMAGGYAEIFVSINVILQYLIVPMNIYCLQCLVCLCARKAGKINEEVIRS